MNIPNGVTPSRSPSVNAAIAQAVLELKSALRASLEAERAIRDGGARNSDHLLRNFETARTRVERARIDLDSLLLDD